MMRAIPAHADARPSGGGVCLTVVCRNRGANRGRAIITHMRWWSESDAMGQMKHSGGGG
jgi:hypothetical protein